MIIKGYFDETYSKSVHCIVNTGTEDTVESACINRRRKIVGRFITCQEPYKLLGVKVFSVSSFLPTLKTSGVKDQSLCMHNEKSKKKTRKTHDGMYKMYAQKGGRVDEKRKFEFGQIWIYTYKVCKVVMPNIYEKTLTFRKI